MTTRVLQVPRVVRGQRIRAEIQNRTAEAVNSILAPQDLDAGNVSNLGNVVMTVTNEKTTSVRVENPEDSAQFVDLDRTTAFTVDPGRLILEALELGIPITFQTFKSD